MDFFVDTILAIISVDYCLFLWNGGVFAYLVSEAFLQAVQENTRRYYWIGKITTKNGMIYEVRSGADCEGERVYFQSVPWKQ